MLKKSDLFKVVREGEIIFKGEATEIRHLKEEVDVIQNNMDCGIRLKDFNEEYKPGDEIICYKNVQKTQETDWDPGF